MESKEKIRVSLLLDRDLVETADKIMKERGYRSRNQFYSALLADAVADEVTDISSVRNLQRRWKLTKRKLSEQSPKDCFAMRFI